MVKVVSRVATILRNQNTENTSHISNEDLVGQYNKHIVPRLPPKQTVAGSGEKKPQVKKPCEEKVTLKSEECLFSLIKKKFVEDKTLRRHLGGPRDTEKQ